MMLDDQEMTEEWIVRVEGREYGPADITTLREWKAEGRLVPANDARRANVDFWTTAAEIPGLFRERVLAPAAARQAADAPVQLPGRNLIQVLARTFRIYRRGFFQFLGLTMLILLPSLCSQLTTAFVQPPHGSNVDARSVLAAGFAFMTFILSIVMWPIYIAGIQILTAEIARDHRPGFLALLNDAVRFWPRIAGLCLFVYGVFFLLMVFGLLIAAMAVAGGPSVLLVLVAVALLIVQVWMFGRFFVNVLFWQQFAVLENSAFIDSLRQSRDFARSKRDRPWFERPMWQGALIASIWFAFVLAITLAAQWDAIQHYLNELVKTQDAQALFQQMTEAQQGSSFEVSAFALGVVEKILQPLLGIAFVVVYLNSKVERPSHMEPIVSAGESDTVR